MSESRKKPARTPSNSQTNIQTGDGEQGVALRDEMRTERLRAALSLRKRRQIDAEEALMMVLFPSKEVLAAQYARRGIELEGA